MAVAPFEGDWQLGQSRDLVVQCHQSQDCWLLHDQWSGRWFRTEFAGLSEGFWTLYDFVLREPLTERVPMVSTGVTALCLPRAELSMASFQTMREVCAGMGGFSLGAQAVGIKTVAFLDRSPLSEAKILRNGGQFILADIHDRAAVKQLHCVEPDSRSLLSVGLPCQSYSVQGSGLGLRDDRGLTLFPVLRAAWILQSSGIIMECVSEILQHVDTMQVLQEFAARAGYQFQFTVLELAHQWGSRRKRWWAVFLPRNGRPFQLPTWMQQSWVVQDVIPEWPVWSQADEDSLAWDEEELSMFLDPQLPQQAGRFGSGHGPQCRGGHAARSLHPAGHAAVLAV